MNNKLVMIIILVVVLAALGVGAWWVISHQDKTPDEVPTKEIFVDAKDSSGNRVVVDFIVMANKTEVGRGKTRTDGLESIKVPSQYQVYEFYPQSKQYYTVMNALVGNQISLDVIPVGNIQVTHTGDVSDTQGQVKLNLSSDGINLATSICLRWSINVIRAENDKYPQVRTLNNKFDCLEAGYEWIPEKTVCGFWCKAKISKANVTAAHCSVEQDDILPPTRLKDKVPVCYYMKETLEKGKQTEFIINYEAYPTVNNNDYVEVIVIDSNNDVFNRYKFEDSETKDWGVPDLIYKID